VSSHPLSPIVIDRKERLMSLPEPVLPSAAATAATLPPAVLARDLELRDLTDPRHGPHAVQLVVDAVVDALARAWSSEIVLWRTHPIVSIEDNYDRLGYAPDAAARSSRYSRYVSETCMLRAHTSAMIPPLLRRIATGAAGLPGLEPGADLLCVVPGITYRRDAIDRLHTGTPHQVDLWRLVARGPEQEPAGQPLSAEDLDDMIRLVVGAVLPHAALRTTPSPHPYTEHGLQVDAEADGTWVEVLECGMAAPHVLAGAGLDPERVSGLAMGLGLDRLVMLRKGVPDIRLLRAEDSRITDQLRDLEPYRPVSQHPGVRRDLSIAVATEMDDELLGDKVRDALGRDADSVEAVEVLSETPYAALPAAAVERIGIQPTQKNLLVRVVLRRVDRTLTDREANELRDRIYAAIHEGARGVWASHGGAGPTAAQR
jgi:phenylalanyl-tRNA synthetase alpha chain